MKTTVLTNLYPGVLWDTPVFTAKKEVESNLYKKEVESDPGFTMIKSDLIESGVSKASGFEIILLKYVPVIGVLWLFFSFNFFYPALIGFSLAVFFYLGYFYIKNRFSVFFANVAVLTFLSLSFIFYFSNFQIATEYKFVWILNYALQYFIVIYAMERIVIDVIIGGYKNWKKVDKATLSYVKIHDGSRAVDDKKSVAKNYYLIVVAFLGFMSFALGSIDVVVKFKQDEAVSQLLEKQTLEEQQILNQKKARSLKQKLLEQAENLNINIPKKDLELLESDFDAYVQSRPISYEKVKVTSTNRIISVSSGGLLRVPESNKHYVFVASVKKYKDGEYRWHFFHKGREYVVMNRSAR